MRRFCGILFLLIICTAASGAIDLLEGGYAGQGGYGDTGQYFNDPLFYPQGGDPYAVADPAVMSMLMSLDMPRESIPRPADPAIRQMEASMDYYSSTGRYGTSSQASSLSTQKYYPTAYYPSNEAGRLQIMLSDGTIIDLTLHQSQNAVNGQGSLNLKGNVQWATARGFIYGNNMQIDVMPADSASRYVISLDMSSLQNMPGRYEVYRYGANPCFGTANAVWLSTSSRY